jgi:hypothetical protein
VLTTNQRIEFSFGEMRTLIGEVCNIGHLQDKPLIRPWNPGLSNLNASVGIVLTFTCALNPDKQFIFMGQPLRYINVFTTLHMFQRVELTIIDLTRRQFLLVDEVRVVESIANCVAFSMQDFFVIRTFATISSTSTQAHMPALPHH